MDAGQRARHRSALVRGGLAEVEAAMIGLLELDDPAVIEPGDVTAVLDAAERPEVQRSSATFELILHLVASGAPATLPPVVDRLERAPLSESGYVAAAVLGEITQRANAPRLLQVGRAVRALAATAAQALQAGRRAHVTTAVDALYHWSRHQPVPEASGAMVSLLREAAGEPSPDERPLRQALAILAANGDLALLSDLVDRAASLHPDHALRRALRDLTP